MKNLKEKGVISAKYTQIKVFFTLINVIILNVTIDIGYQTSSKMFTEII